jgi:hypothetical protein
MAENRFDERYICREKWSDGCEDFGGGNFSFSSIGFYDGGMSEELIHGW